MSKEVKKHTKHTALTKPAGGDYHFNEWAIIGAPCDTINPLALEINTLLKDKLKIGWLDADHTKAKKIPDFDIVHTDKISYQSTASIHSYGIKQNRKRFTDLDLLLINGNHFIGDKQIVIITDEKKESLRKKLDRLTDIRMILLERSSADIHDFIIELVDGKEDLTIFRIAETEKIANAILDTYQQELPKLNALILAGGKSQRMGEDKGAIQYHGKPQREFEADLASKFCYKTFISCRKNQDELIETKYIKLYDTFDGLGPYGGILSAFRAYPNNAWLTLACDLPYLNKSILKQLTSSRNPSKLATCFYNPDTKFPEPLITIWEPRAYSILLEFLSQGYSCPRKVLINTEIEMINMENIEGMKNVNEPAEMIEAIKVLNSKK